jgi:hypothetical protein
LKQQPAQQQQSQPQPQRVQVGGRRSNSNISSKRLIFQVDEGHRSQYTATKYRVDFKHFLDYIRIHDREVLLDLGKEVVQELVIKYTLSLRDNPEKKYSRSTVNNRIAATMTSQY